MSEMIYADGEKRMEVIDSFVVDDGKEKKTVELSQYRIKFLNRIKNLKQYAYIIEVQGKYDSMYFFKFFAERRFNKLRKSHESES